MHVFARALFPLLAVCLCVLLGPVFFGFWLVYVCKLLLLLTRSIFYINFQGAKKNPVKFTNSNREGAEERPAFNMQPYDITQACTNISRKLSKLSVARSECTIYRVHAHLRIINDKAYDPEVIAIGPYHRDKDNLKMMEDHKLRYLQLVLQRKNDVDEVQLVSQRKNYVDEIVSIIGKGEQEARKCYANPISLDAAEFIEMLILDGCFIIELVRKNFTEQLREENDPIFCTAWIKNSLHRDLMLLENQIPFFVLCKLFDLTKVPSDGSTLMDLLTMFYSPIFPGIESSNRSPDVKEIKHLLDLIHTKLLPLFDWRVWFEGGKDQGERRFIESATSLREANVKFKRNEEAGLPLMSFDHGTMYLPLLRIEDSTESFLRSFIAYEQYFPDTKISYVTVYARFLDCLINSQKDVEILSRARIIENWLGDDEAVVDIFNKLTDSVTIGPDKDIICGKIFDEVNKHCKKRRNKWMAKLRRDYLNSPWAIISISAAVVLLLLTVAQTVLSVLQVV